MKKILRVTFKNGQPAEEHAIAELRTSGTGCRVQAEDGRDLGYFGPEVCESIIVEFRFHDRPMEHNVVVDGTRCLVLRAKGRPTPSIVGADQFVQPEHKGLGILRHRIVEKARKTMFVCFRRWPKLVSPHAQLPSSMASDRHLPAICCPNGSISNGFNVDE